MSKAKAPRVFVPLMKVDEEQRLVYGRMTQEVLDKSGEMMDYASSKPNFEKWSAEIEEASGGLSKGNVRVMHGLQVAGKLTDLSFDDDELAIDICAKVVDDAEWNKVLEGCYTGFSVGGKYGKKWTETVNGAQIKKFEAVPNEVSLVDNPCVPSATFTMVKADGAEEQILFKAAAPATEEAPVEEPVAETEVKPEEETVEKTETTEALNTPPSNAAVAERATEMAKEAGGDAQWTDFIEAAREDLLTKAAPPKKDKKKDDESAEDKPDDEKAEGEEDDKEAKKADFTVANRISQKWETSDGKTFEKKADAEAHEDELIKASQPVELSEADKLRERLNKAIAEPEPEVVVELMDDLDRLGKAIGEFENGPVLRKGMGTVAGFARVLCQMANLSRGIAMEGSDEGGDKQDYAVSADIKNAIASLGESFKQYAADQIDELLSGVDDDDYVSFYDYYYAAAHSDGENQLAKDVCSLLEGRRDSSRERRDVLAKAFGVTEVEETNEVSEDLQKRFDALAAENVDLRKVASEAIEKVEELAKRVTAVEETPMPRAPAPGSIALREGDVPMNFLGKSFASQDELRAHLHNMIKTEGPDALAIQMIKAAQTQGQPLHLNR